MLIDQTSFAKFALKGPDALAALNWICANNVDKPVGSLTYTQMLDDSGGIQCDLTVCRVADDEFYIVTGTGFATHDFDWIQRSMPADMNAQLFDITSANTVLSLMGPTSRDVLEAVTRADVSNECVPVRHAADHRHRRLSGARPASHLRRRVGMGAAPARGVRDDGVRRADGRRAARTA